MMSPIVTDGDELKFDPMFGNRQVTLTSLPARIAGSGRATVDGKQVCIVGDELKVKLSATYITPNFSIAGTGLVTISGLDNDQIAQDCINGRALITQGSQFDACFTPTKPAEQPGTPNNILDSMSPSYGKGEFRVQQRASTAGSA
ncbi:hypothetical protein [Burkholderia ubonensis]|uniref:hypothetical protein n=1 Tax=Burkholderia ubonensis TaxID=101571 RepID=UPI000756CC85|nr:hypothetical protein [Burkholderia ubonensis]KVN28366.1 hypothetical protein WJ64_16655 [Burkholderia ubonensis]